MTEVVEIAGGSTIVVEDNTVTIIEVGTQGPAGPPGPPGVGIVEVDFGTLGASVTATVDSVTIATERCANWQVCVETTGGGKSQTWTVMAVNDGGTSVNHAVFGKVRAPVAGGSLKITTNVDISGGLMRLRLMNNEAFSVEVSVIRISVSP